MSRFQTARQLFAFLARRKKAWLVPVLTFLVLLALVLVLAETSVFSAFLYSLF